MTTTSNNDKPDEKNSATPPPKRRLIIEGVTHTGDSFRPSNWAERIGGKLSTFSRSRLYYSPLLHPGMHKGNKCILLDKQLKKTNPKLYQSILNFAKTNNLWICDEEDEEEG